MIRTARGIARAVVLGLVLLLAGGPDRAQAAPKTDVVVLKNGDRITCEIRHLNRGKLEVKTDDIGTIDIEWDKIESITAKGLFEIEDLAGGLYFGPLETIPEKGLEVATATGIDTVPLAMVVRMTTIKASFWERLTGSLNVGFGYTKSSDISEFNSDATVRFTRPTFSAKLDASSLIQRQQDGNDTTRNTGSLIYTRILESRRFALGRLGVEQNRELGFEVRASLAGGWGKYFIRSQGNELAGAAGLSVNREVPIEGEATDHLEAMFAFDWANFAYDFPKTDIEIVTRAYLGLTTWGRFRADLDARISREIFSDFTAGLKGYYNFDSQAPSTGESEDDYQISLTLGYKF